MATKKRHALFPVKFPKQLEDWKEQQKEQGEKGSQYEFAKQVGVPGYRVTDWKTGRSGIPHSYIDQICEVLGVSPDVYEPTTRDEKYHHSSDYITEIGKSHVEFAKSIGLDLDLIRSLSEKVDFDKCFPLYSPIDPEHKRINPDTFSFEFNREVNYMDSAPIDGDLSFLQINRDGKTITFHKCDLAFLKEVQDKIARYVNFLFYDRLQEMEEETKRFNDDLRIDNGDGVISIKSPSWDFVNEHDRFAKYAFEFEKDGE